MIVDGSPVVGDDKPTQVVRELVGLLCTLHTSQWLSTRYEARNPLVSMAVEGIRLVHPCALAGRHLDLSLSGREARLLGVARLALVATLIK
jgi:hypothetical protein